MTLDDEQWREMCVSLEVRLNGIQENIYYDFALCRKACRYAGRAPNL